MALIAFRFEGAYDVRTRPTSDRLVSQEELLTCDQLLFLLVRRSQFAV